MHKLQVRTASGSSLCPTGTITCDFKLGKQPFSFELLEAIFLRKGEILRHLEKEDITIEEITTETMLQCKDMESEKLNCGDSLKKMFIASSVSDDTCKKVRLQDVEALRHCKVTIEEVTAEAMSQCKDMESGKLNCGDKLKKNIHSFPCQC